MRIGLDVMSQYSASETCHSLSHDRSDSAGTNDSYRLAVQIKSNETVQGEVSLADTRVSTVSLPIQGQDQGNRVFCHGMRRIFRYTNYRNASLLRRS